MFVSAQLSEDPTSAFHQVEVWTLTRPDLLLCLCSLFCLDQASLEYFVVQEESMAHSVTARCSGPVAAERAQILTRPPPCLAVWVLQTWGCALWPDIYCWVQNAMLVQIEMCSYK
ncbi:hypothetical protein CHARACLAT_011833 [Characodon lateralis]|uniref:Uncharacterized protein n=1 Tax=Characodon lateralis TaxID=208331 RepID=A0ABU7F4S9_9TELE|nr:hypothetical protein [Characodon lateralis]